MKIEILTLCATPTHMKIKQITQIRYYVGMKMLWLLLLFGLLQFGNSLCRADLSPEEVSRVTTEIQEFEPKWTDKQTQEATSRGRNGLAMSAYGSFRLKVEGDTVWVNGKQITANLGTNITRRRRRMIRIGHSPNHYDSPAQTIGPGRGSRGSECFASSWCVFRPRSRNRRGGIVQDRNHHDSPPA